MEYYGLEYDNDIMNYKYLLLFIFSSIYAILFYTNSIYSICFAIYYSVKAVFKNDNKVLLCHITIFGVIIILF